MCSANSASVGIELRRFVYNGCIMEDDTEFFTEACLLVVTPTLSHQSQEYVFCLHLPLCFWVKKALRSGSG